MMGRGYEMKKVAETGPCSCSAGGQGGPSFREGSRDLSTLTGRSGELERCSVCSGMSLGESEQRNNWLFFFF